MKIHFNQIEFTNEQQNLRTVAQEYFHSRSTKGRKFIFVKRFAEEIEKKICEAIVSEVKFKQIFDSKK